MNTVIWRTVKLSLLVAIAASLPKCPEWQQTKPLTSANVAHHGGSQPG